MYISKTNTSVAGCHCLGLGNIWNDQNSHVCLPSLRQRLKDHFIKKVKIQCESKCYVYKYLATTFVYNFTLKNLYKKYIKNVLPQ